MKIGSWKNRRLVITAGPTREALDPVRYISNESSGLMGWALAETAQEAGAQVTLVAGPTRLAFPKNMNVIPVVSARDMLNATRRVARRAHAVIGAAAVADWRPEIVSRTKLKKTGETMVLRLTPNPDILGTLATERRGPFPRLAGFALETQMALAHAKKKMAAKNLDVIVANSPAALGSHRTQAWILRPNASPERFQGTKKGLARRLLAQLLISVQNHDR